jgi:hypothetical protein
VPILTPRSGTRIRDELPRSFFRELRNNFLGKKYLNSFMQIRNLFDPGSGMEKYGSGFRDKHPESATLLFRKLIIIAALGWETRRA